MPLFEYACRDCGRDFERIVPTSTATVTCPECGKAHVEKKLSVFAVSNGTGEPELAAGACGACGAAEPGTCGL